MADVTGPISSLPGTTHDSPEGATCDNHPDRIAVVRKQGETDSFGCEMYDLCAECVEEWNREERERDKSGTCDWCKAHKPRLRTRRDYEEGMTGPVYLVCDDCIERDNKRWEDDWEDDWNY